MEAGVNAVVASYYMGKGFWKPVNIKTEDHVWYILVLCFKCQKV